MDQLLLRHGMVNVASTTVFVESMRGPLEQDWTDKVEGLVAWLLSSTASEQVQGPSSPSSPYAPTSMRRLPS